MRGSVTLVKLKGIILAHWAFFAFLVAMSIAYFDLHSISLENFDAGSFAIYVRDGYIYPRLYIPYALFLELGRELHLWTGVDTIVLLTSINSVSALISLICQYVTIILLLRDKRVALLATVLLAFSNQFWLTAEEAVSDMFALALTSVAVCLVVIAWRHQNVRWGFLSYLAFGFSIGGRLTQIMFLGIPFLLRVGARRKFDFVSISSGVGIGIVAWLIPTWLYYPEIFNSMRSLFPSPGRPLGVLDLVEPLTLQGLLYRVIDWGIVRNYLLYNFGAWFYQDIPTFRAMASLLLLLGAVFATRKYLRPVGLAKLVYVIWMIPYFLFSTFAFEFSREPSIILQILPPIAAVLAVGFSNLSKPVSSKISNRKSIAKTIHIMIPILFLILLFTFTFSNVLTLHLQRSGVDGIADYIEAHYTPSQIRLVYSWEWTRLAYYIPQYVDYNLFVTDPANEARVTQALSDFSSKSVLITGQAIDLVKAIALSKGYTLRYQEIFRQSRSDLVNARDGTDELYIVLYFSK